MQFKHPEILWALLLLLLPILIHLLQLRRFKKTPFTNVTMLKKVVSESRKSQNLKKWLLLFTRLLLIAALILAFAQPFSSKSDALTQRETIVYLDNSFSMQAKKDGMSLLRKTVQDLIQEIPESAIFSLFTNTKTYQNVTIKQIQNELLSLENSSKQLSLDQIQLKAGTLFSSTNTAIKEVLLLSDFQNRNPPTNEFKNAERYYMVQLIPDRTDNVYIDSLYLGESDGNQLALTIEVVGLKEEETTPISLYDGNRLIAKTAVKGTADEKIITELSLEKGKPIKGKVVIEDPVLRYDNHFYFNIDKRQRPKVLVISETENLFLERLFKNDDFEYLGFQLAELNYSEIGSQNVIILNGLKSVPSSLSAQLIDFSNNGGSLVIIPAAEAIDLSAYNALLSPILPLQFKKSLGREQQISKITFQHPLYENVFEKEVTNFDYPTVQSNYEAVTTGSTALSYDDGSPFLISQENCFVFTAALDRSNSTFINSPLVVPTFYNIGELSLKNPALYQSIGKNQRIDIAGTIDNDDILKLSSANEEFIPLQQAYTNKVQLNFGENPTSDGIYAVRDGVDTLQQISFNHARSESLLAYYNTNELDNTTPYSNVSSLFEALREDTSITDYWKWFIIFALLFALLELLIQKLLP